MLDIEWFIVHYSLDQTGPVAVTLRQELDLFHGPRVSPAMGDQLEIKTLKERREL
jgi:hypothetical protein